MADDGSSTVGAQTVGKRQEASPYVFLVLMILIGSSTAPSAKYIVRELPTGFVPLVRFGCAGLVLLPIVWRSPAFRRMLRRDLKRLLLTAALCVPINQAFFLNGTKLAPTTHVALIYSSCPLIVLGLATLIGQERLAAGRLLGVLSSVAGLLVIAVGNVAGSATGRDVFLGDMFLVGAVVSWGAYLTAGKLLVARYGSLPVLAGTFFFGGLLDIPVALATVGSWGSFANVSPRAWIALAHLTVVVSIFGLFFQNQSLQKLDASQVATFGNLAPLLTIVWGGLLFGERLTPILALGGGLIFLGLFGANRPTRHPAPISEASA